jgi:hypothetical protein
MQDENTLIKQKNKRRQKENPSQEQTENGGVRNRHSEVTRGLSIGMDPNKQNKKKTEYVKQPDRRS